MELLNKELLSTHIVGEFILAPGKPPHVRASKALEIIFGTFRPHHLGVIREKLASEVNAELVGSIKTAIDPKLPVVAPALSQAIERSADTFSQIASGKFGLTQLEEMEAALRSDFEKALAADTWRKRFRGRDVLNRFVARIHKTNYEVFRDLIIARMRDSLFQPEGMRSVIEKIMAA